MSSNAESVYYPQLLVKTLTIQRLSSSTIDGLFHDTIEREHFCINF